MTLSNPLFLAGTAGAFVWGAAAVAASPPTWRNSLGMEFVKVPAGTFQMGQEEGYWDEQPVHSVTLSEPFWMSVAEVTLEQFRQFQPDFPGTAEAAPAAAGVSWYQAQAFCEWLSRKEGRPYRLPTEAEWEYACRLDPPAGLENLLAGVLEWCLDWYGPYPESPQVDPVGPASGLARVVRGGCLDEPGNPAYRRPTCRAGMAPAFGIQPGAGNRFGSHLIGFRLVQAPPPQGSSWTPEPAFVQQGVKQTAAAVSWGPDPAKPYFRKRYLLPTPPENSPPEAIEAAGLHPAFRGHNHSPALEVCPNGDLLLIIYTSYHEYEPEVSLIASRLRFGAEEWDFPDLLFDFPGVNDHAPLLWNDGGTLHCFWGNPRLTGAFPFQWTSSRDSGATWDEVRFPEFRNQVGPHSRQPINTAFRGPDGTMYVASDGEGGQSLLWVSTDHGRTWIDPGGRTGGRHTTFVLLRDGRILGLGGKNTDLGGFMPQSVSSDGGKTWQVSPTPFPAQGANQRPCVLRLASGRLFFAGDYQHISGQQPPGVTERGCYVALSEDEGRTWRFKKLVGTQPHEDPSLHGGADTLGYSVARQAPNGLIHLITTMNRPCLHFEMNEAWILSGAEGPLTEKALMASTATKVVNLRAYEETYPDGKIRLRWQAGRGDDGRYLLHGRETWYYEDGRKQREATYRLGRKVGREVYWGRDGRKVWEWQHGEDGTSTWTQYWPDGTKKAQSTWRNFHCQGTATRWDRSGRVLSQVEFTGQDLRGN